MERTKVLRETSDYVKRTLEGEGSGHDWWHIVRVRNTALHIAKEEKADEFIVELAALLHDIADWKFNNDDTSKGAKVAKTWLQRQDVETKIINAVCEIIEHLSFKGAGVDT